ncbi:MAG TPA: DSD1 family PLP-dependent enzyme [Burkholderiales bacterium]|nr:DSD1 family PLP-dependent enzyme [Burkholderiales bacterium]
MLPPPASPGQRLGDVDTPALVVDLDAFERNLSILRETLKGRKIRVRPHAKTHKSADISKIQIADGAVGVCCQKVSEAQALVEGGVPDILVSNEVVGAQKIARLVALAPKARIGVCVDNLRNLRDIAAASGQAGARLDLYVELEVGMARCGVPPGPAAVELVKEILRHPHLRFGGLQAYHGRAQHLRTMEERRDVISRAAEGVKRMKELLRKENIECPLVTGAGSGTFMFEVESGTWDEIQPGSYVFMDADYARNEWKAPLPRFEHSLFVLSTVMSRPSDRMAILDAGLKASSVDSGLPEIWKRPGLEYTHASDEHGWLEGSDVPPLGEKVLLVPGHCDPTVNLYDWYVCVRKGKVEALWPVSARGAHY